MWLYNDLNRRKREGEGGGGGRGRERKRRKGERTGIGAFKNTPGDCNVQPEAHWMGPIPFGTYPIPSW